MNKIKRLLRLILPRKLTKFIKYLKIRKDIVRKKDQYNAKLQELKNKHKIKVVFFVIHSSVWKYDELYMLLEEDPLFDPLIVVCPYLKVDDGEMFQEMQSTYDLFKEKKFNVIKSYVDKKQNWIDVHKEFNPDIIFYSVPYSYTREEYQYSNFDNVLNCYVQYSLHVSHLNSTQYDQLFHNLIWKIFCETEIHLRMAKKFATNNGSNVIQTGYPGTDIYLKNKKIEKNPWGVQEQRKKIIWSPHHTIEEGDANLGYSNFLKYNQIFIKILKEYKDEIIVCFKPHPILKNRLYNHKDWGKKKTDKYYHFWETNENSILNESEYIDLFLTSDAIINDSGSFLAEYLYINKPNLFMVRSSLVLNRFNEFGKKCLEVTYKSYNEEGLISFIEEQVLEGEDPLQSEREKFISNYLIPPNDQSASENIVNYIKNELS